MDFSFLVKYLVEAVDVDIEQIEETKAEIIEQVAQRCAALVVERLHPQPEEIGDGTSS